RGGTAFVASWRDALRRLDRRRVGALLCRRVPRRATLHRTVTRNRAVRRVCQGGSYVAQGAVLQQPARTLLTIGYRFALGPVSSVSLSVIFGCGGGSDSSGGLGGGACSGPVHGTWQLHEFVHRRDGGFDVGDRRRGRSVALRRQGLRRIVLRAR